MDRTPYYFLTTVGRAARVLEQFIGSDAELKGSEIAQRLGLHKSVVHRLLATLTDLGYLAVGTASGSYRLGVKSLELGLSYLRHSPIERVAQIHMSRLIATFPNMATHVAILDGTEIVYQRTIAGPEAHYMGLTMGRRQPAYCNALGKVLLAYLSTAELESYLATVQLRPFTCNTLTSPSALMQELTEIRSREWALDNQENFVDRRCVAAPIRNHTGAVVAALSLAGLPEYYPTYGQDALVASVQASAAAIARDMGHLRSHTHGPE